MERCTYRAVKKKKRKAEAVTETYDYGVEHHDPPVRIIPVTSWKPPSFDLHAFVTCALPSAKITRTKECMSNVELVKPSS